MVIFVALVCLLAHHALAITELTDANFYDYAKEKDVLLVNFYAPWCGDCKNLAPDLETAASTLGTRGLDLAKVDCFGAGKGLCDTYGIKRWPTLKNFNRGSYTGDYNGGLTSNEIAGYIATVENSIAPANPYAMAIPPPVTQACMAKCHIAKITNKQPCYSKCKTKNFATHNGVRKLAPVKFSPPKPIINEHSCAKCRIPQPPGKLRHLCTPAVENQCFVMEKQWNKLKASKHGPSIAPDLFQDREKLRAKAGVATASNPKKPVVGKAVVTPSKDDKTHVKVFTKGFTTGFTTGFTAGFTTGSIPKNAHGLSPATLKSKTQGNPTGRKEKLTGLASKQSQKPPHNTINASANQAKINAGGATKQRKMAGNANVINEGKSFGGIRVSVEPPKIFSSGIGEYVKTPENTALLPESKPTLKDQAKPQPIAANRDQAINENSMLEHRLASNETENRETKHPVSTSGQLIPVESLDTETKHEKNANIIGGNVITQGAKKAVDLLPHDVAMKIPYDVDDKKKATVPKISRHLIVNRKRTYGKS